MIDIKELYDTVLDLISKNNGEYISPEEFNRYVNIASLSYFDDITGSKTNPRIVYGKNRITDRRLDTFREEFTTVVPVDRRIDLPEGLEFIRTVIDTEDRTAVVPVDEDREGMLSRDPFAKPDKTNKYYTEGKGFIKILNTDLEEIEIKYLRKPVKAEYSYTRTGTRGRPEYDPTNSENLEWNERETNEIITRILERVSLSLRDAYLAQNNNVTKSQE